MLDRSAFTLIELLVVIAVLALLMAVLAPSLQRARKYAKSVACQSNLRQWNLLFNMYLDDYGGCFWDNQPRYEWLWKFKQYRLDYDAFALCPMARRFDSNDPAHSSSIEFHYAESIEVSYGANGWLSRSADGLQAEYHWAKRDVKGASNVPALFDCSGVEAMPLSADYWSPPDTPPVEWKEARETACIDRHGEGINMLFLDGSACPLGLKGLWTLKWNRKFDTAGKWTLAGGIQPEDWPEWMRGFRDY